MSLVSCMCESANSITGFKFLQILFLRSPRETQTANLFLVTYICISSIIWDIKHVLNDIAQPHLFYLSVHFFYG